MAAPRAGASSAVGQIARACGRPVRVETGTVLIVAEAMHESASSDVQKLIAALAQAIKTIWPVSP